MASVACPTNKRGKEYSGLWVLASLAFLAMLIILLAQVLRRTGLWGGS